MFNKIIVNLYNYNYINKKEIIKYELLFLINK